VRSIRLHFGDGVWDMVMNLGVLRGRATNGDASRVPPQPHVRISTEGILEPPGFVWLWSDRKDICPSCAVPSEIEYKATPDDANACNTTHAGRGDVSPKAGVPTDSTEDTLRGTIVSDCSVITLERGTRTCR
jgi:hypothetical protein